MEWNRRQVNVGLLASALFGTGPLLHGQADQTKAGATPAAGRRNYFFQNSTFAMLFLTSLGRAYHSGGDVGKVLYLTRQVEDGNYESASSRLSRPAIEARALAEESAAAGHRESARQAYLWAQNFYDSATYFVDQSKDPTRFLPTWELLYDCWLKSPAILRAAD